MQDIIIEGGFALVILIDLAILVIQANHKEHIQKLEAKVSELEKKRTT